MRTIRTRLTVLDPRRLVILTGLPGSGKTRVANILRAGLGDDWEVVHADDFIGPTYARFRDPVTGARPPWESVRAYHPRLLGESAAFHMLDHRKNVLVEGHIRNRGELANLKEGLAAVLHGDREYTVEVFIVEQDRSWIVERMAANKHRFPEWFPPLVSLPERKRRLREWVFGPATLDTVGMNATVVPARGANFDRVAVGVAKAAGLDLTPPVRKSARPATGRR